MTSPDRLSLYLDRLGLERAPPASAEGLATLQAAHRERIPFENLDVRLGRPPAIDSEAVFGKLVTRRRGGYCFEHNRLFSDMLATLGIPNRPLLARVRLGVAPDETPPRTHVLLLAQIDGAPWIADAGFGGSYVPPLPLRDGASVRTGDGAAHRLRRIGEAGDPGGEWLLERAGDAGATDGRAGPQADWQAQYGFDLLPVVQADLDQCNHWTATRPATRFTTLHVVSIALPDGFASLTEQALKVHRGGVLHEAVLAGPDDYHRCLAGQFHLDLDREDLARLPLFSKAMRR